MSSQPGRTHVRQGVDWRGGALALSAAATFGTIPITAKLAYRAGITVTELQVIRFVVVNVGLAALIYWSSLRHPAQVSWRRLVVLALFGAAVYGPQSFLFFTALTLLPASQVELVFYVYPALVVVGAWLLYRRPLSWRRVLAVIAGIVGAALVVGLGTIRPTPALTLAVASPVVYAGYLLLVERLLKGVGVVVGTAAVTFGAMVFWITLMTLRMEVTLPAVRLDWVLPMTLIAMASLWSVPALFAAVLRIGSDTVAVISTFEPVVTVVLAALILFERLTLTQALGALFVLVAVVLTQAPRRETGTATRRLEPSTTSDSPT